MEKSDKEKVSRRDVLKTMVTTGLASTVTFGAVKSYEERCLAQEAAEGEKTAAAATKVDATSGATRTSFKMPDRVPLNEKVPLAKIGNVTVSRLILGGNLIGGYAHSRDLIYVSELVKAYHTEQKCVETFMIAEECGINSFLGDWKMGEMMANYWKWTDGKIQLIAQCPDDMNVVQETIDNGAVAIYPNGETCDRLVAEQRYDFLEAFLTKVRDAGLPAGFGAHRIETLRGIIEHGLVPDFWMKTFHPLTYWSARHPQEWDNVFCRKPEETKEFMAERPEPWIAFKTLAAGAITPMEGFQFCLEGGADFICVGMYDFQIVNDVNLYTSMIKNPLNRTRRTLETVDRALYEEELERLEEEEEDA